MSRCSRAEPWRAMAERHKVTLDHPLIRSDALILSDSQLQFFNSDVGKESYHSVSWCSLCTRVIPMLVSPCLGSRVEVAHPLVPVTIVVSYRHRCGVVQVRGRGCRPRPTAPREPFCTEPLAKFSGGTPACKPPRPHASWLCCPLRPHGSPPLVRAKHVPLQRCGFAARPLGPVDGRPRAVGRAALGCRAMWARHPTVGGRPCLHHRGRVPVCGPQPGPRHRLCDPSAGAAQGRGSARRRRCGVGGPLPPRP